MGRFFTNRTSGKFFPGGPQQVFKPKPRLVFDAEAELPGVGCCQRIAFVTGEGGAVTAYTWTPTGGWVADPGAGAGQTLTFPTEAIPAVDAQYVYAVSINGGVVDGPNVIETFAFRNGQLLTDAQFTLAAGNFTLDGGEPAPGAGEIFTVVLVVNTP